MATRPYRVSSIKLKPAPYQNQISSRQPKKRENIQLVVVSKAYNIRSQTKLASQTQIENFPSNVELKRESQEAKAKDFEGWGDLVEEIESFQSGKGFFDIKWPKKSLQPVSFPSPNEVSSGRVLADPRTYREFQVSMKSV